MSRYKLVSWNVNGIRAAERKGLLGWFAQEKPDVLCLQEVKARPEQLSADLANVKGYAFDMVYAETKGYSGVGTYARPAAKAVEKGMGDNQFDQEGRVIIHRFPEFSLFNVYFPNGKRSPERLAYKLAFYEAFIRMLERRRKRGEKRQVVCGDVNTAHKEIDLARPRENSDISGFLPQERAWIDRLLEAGYIDTFRRFETGPDHYTYWDQMTRARERNVGWRIDYFFTSDALTPHLKAAFHRPAVQGSDHCPIGIDLRF